MVDGRESDGALALLDRIRLSARVGQRHPVERIRLGVVGRVMKLSLTRDAGGVAVGLRARRVPSKRIRAGERQPP